MPWGIQLIESGSKRSNPKHGRSGSECAGKGFGRLTVNDPFTKESKSEMDMSLSVLRGGTGLAGGITTSSYS